MGKTEPVVTQARGATNRDAAKLGICDHDGAAGCRVRQSARKDYAKDLF